MADELLVVDDLKKHFPVSRGIIFKKQIGAVKAVDGVSFSLREGETLGVVGESGCGKSTMARCIIKLLDPTDGKIVFKGRDISKLSRSEMRPLRREMMMVFQDPYASLNARKRVGFIVAEGLDVHGDRHAPGAEAPRPRAARGRRAEPRALQPLPARVLRRAAPADRDRARARDQPEPDRLRRAGLGARRLRAGPDPQPAQGPAEGVRAHLRLHRPRPQRRPAHLGSGHGDVPRQGRRGRGRSELYAAPKHPYTGALLSAVPIPDPDLGRQRLHLVLEGDVPNPINPPSACNFHPRCPRFHQGHCDVEDPELRSVGGNGQAAACHYPLEKWPMTAAEMRSGASGTPQSEHLEPELA